MATPTLTFWRFRYIHRELLGKEPSLQDMADFSSENPSDLDLTRTVIDSKDFQALNLSDSAFIDTLYNNLLHRNPDPQGATFWNNFLTTNAEQKSAAKALVVTAFKKSPESIATDQASNIFDETFRLEKGATLEQLENLHSSDIVHAKSAFNHIYDLL